MLSDSSMQFLSLVDIHTPPTCRKSAKTQTIMTLHAAAFVRRPYAPPIRHVIYNPLVDRQSAQVPVGRRALVEMRHHRRNLHGEGDCTATEVCGAFARTSVASHDVGDPCCSSPPLPSGFVCRNTCIHTGTSTPASSFDTSDDDKGTRART